MSRPIVYDLFLIPVPGDLCDGLPDDEARKGLCEQAIVEARERADYAMPSTWMASIVSGEPGSWEVKCRVLRKRFK